MRRAAGDRGSIVVMTAVGMVALLGTVAVVIDLGYLRSDRRDARSAADAGATSGALARSNPSTPIAVCTDAFAYTFQNLRISTDSSAISTACGSFASACTSGASRTATVTAGSTTVKVTNPVADTSPLMQGTELGQGVPQPAFVTSDGKDCDRVGVEIIRPEPTMFSSIFSSQARNYSVHAVARYSNVTGPNIPTPALVALNQTACGAISAGTNGNIVLKKNITGPGVAYSDSNGPNCPSSNPYILASKSSGRLVAESADNVIGELGWFQAPSTIGYNNSSSTYQSVPASFSSTTQNYVGQLTVMADRITRVPVDDVFHCTNAINRPNGCSTATDPVLLDQQEMAAPGSYGFSVYSGPCDTSAGTVSLSGKVWIKNCPTFTVKTGTLDVAAGSTVIFEGALAVQAGGNLYVNSTGASDASGYPVPTDPAQQSALLVKSTSANAISVQSTSVVISMAQTMIYNNGGVNLQGSPALRWTPPMDPAQYTRGLLYWGESTQPFSIQGGPSITARGIVFHGNGPLQGGGGGTIDLTNVQMWVNTASTSGTTTVLLAPDPDLHIASTRSAAGLIR